MPNITPFLWFNDEAEQAINEYVSIFPNSRIVGMQRYPEGAPGGMAGRVMSGQFVLDGRPYMAMNGGPHYKLNPAFSMHVSVDTQKEVDELWERLTADGGSESRCGWLVDKYGLSWQIIPKALGELMADPDPVKAGRVMNAMLQMNKIDILTLIRAYEG